MRIRVEDLRRLTAEWAVPAWSAFALAGFGLVSYLPQLLGVGSTAVTVPYRAAVLAGALVLLPFVLSQGSWRPSAGFWLFLVFWSCYMVRLFSDVVVCPVPLVRQPSLYLQFAIGACLVPSLVFFSRQVAVGQERFLKILWLLLFTSAGLALVSDLPTDGTEHLRMAGNETENPISLGRIGAGLVVLSAFRFINQRVMSVWKSPAYVGAMLIGLMVSFLAGSRGPIVALAFSLLILLVFRFGKGNRKAIFALAILLSAATPLLVRMTTDYGGALVERFLYMGDSDNVREDIRAQLVREGWTQFLENPLTGKSLDIAYADGYPHNILVEAFMSTGVVGGTLLAALMGWGALRSLRLLYARSPEEWVGLLYLTYCLGALLSGTIYTNLEFWYLYGGVMASRPDGADHS